MRTECGHRKGGAPLAKVFRLVPQVGPHRRLETRREKFLLGRSPDCEIVLADPHVSRHQAEVWQENGRHRIRNLGRSDMQLNGQPAVEGLLASGDVIAFGGSRFEYLSEAAADPAEADSGAAKTVLVTDPGGEASPERLICTRPDGTATAHALEKEAVLIGRGPDCDLVIDDPSVSRRHCLVEKRGAARIARNVSTTNPIAVNGRAVDEATLAPGDALRIGGCSLLYAPYTPAGGNPAEAVRTASRRGPRPRAWIAAAGAALAIAAAWLGHAAYGDWQTGRKLEALSRKAAGGDFAQARRELRPILERGLPPGQRRTAATLLAQTTAEIARSLAREGLLAAAIIELEAFPALPEAGAEAARLGELLQGFRLDRGRELEAAGELSAAVAAYRAVAAESPFYAEARLSAHRLEEAIRREQERQQTVRELLRQAELLFAEKRYFAPSGQGAVRLYQAVLAIDPENAEAAGRIEELKALFRDEGERHFKAGEWPQALEAFTRLNLVEPDDAEVRQQIAACGRRLAGPAEPPAARRPAGARVSASLEERRRVERLLKEAGAESPWIMRYLFDEPSHAERKSETPW